MRVLVACEESQRVCMEFRKRGHEAYSCDILPCGGGHSEWHIQADALEVVKMQWDMVLAFPPCTHLAVSGASWFSEKRRDGRQQMGVGFFLAFTALDHVPMVAIENPVGIMSSIYRKPDQIIQPYEFGEPTKKATCLWLKGLPLLKPTNIVEPMLERHRKKDGTTAVYGGGIGTVNDETGKALAWNNPMTARIRSKTFYGVANAMAEQWGGLDVPAALGEPAKPKPKYEQITFKEIET